MSEIRKVIDSLKEDILALDAMMPEDKPKPREWRLWDMVRNGDVAWIRTRPNYWVSMRDGSTTVDQDMNLKDDIYLANLADLLAQGDMLVGLTEDEAKHIETVCFNCSGCAAMWHKVRAALAAREGKK